MYRSGLVDTLVTHANMKGLGLTPLFGDRRGFMPPQLKTKTVDVDFQCKSLQKIFVIVLILYPNLTFLAFRAYLLEPPPQDYITKGKTIKNLNIKKCDKNYCTHSI